MPTPRQCAECGASLPNDAPDGPCPACGLRAALKADPHPAESFHPSALFDPIEPGSRRREAAEGSQAAAPPPHPSISPDGEEGARKTGEGDAQSQSEIANPKSAIGNLRYFGDYELLEEIARGGMGVVYRARQVSLNRTVAVKMILAGQLASAADVQRFRAEAEAAANLQHPNIVAIHEVGEHAGQHYFSMDYVEGKNLAELVTERATAFTGPSGSLSPSEGERAGVRGPSGISSAQWLRCAAGYAKTISEAIQYAHDQGTLHRDLKPSNVLIDAHDQPRITDFGLAKRVERRSELRVEGGDGALAENAQLSAQDPSQLTLTGQVLGSPNFMPPEQAVGKRGQVGPQSDVYALGAILYHLLTARPPFLAETLTETLQQVQHTDPIGPRLLNLAVPRDLETICLKCLEKEPRQRYATAQALADDLGRYLNSEPVHARPIGPAGKAARWCRRKPALASALAACALVLVSGIAGITWQWRRAEQNAKNELRQRQHAQENAARSEQVAQFLKDMLKAVEPSVSLGRDTTMLRDILDKTAVRLGNELTNEPAIEADLREIIGEVYLGLGDYPKAEAMVRKVLELRKKLLGDEHQAVATALHNLAVALDKQGSSAEAVALFRQALTMRRTFVGNEHPLVAVTLHNLGGALYHLGNYAEAEVVCREALAMHEKLQGNEDPAVANALNDLGAVLQDQGKYAEAETNLCEALARRKKLLGDVHPDVALSLHNLARVRDKLGKHVEAETLYREAVVMWKKLVGEEHPDVAAALINLAEALIHQQRYTEAEKLCRDGLAMGKKLLGNENRIVADALNDLAFALTYQGNYAEAELRFSEALAMRRRLLRNDHPHVANSLNNLAWVLDKQGKYAEAEALYRDALLMRKKLLGDNHPFVAHSLASLAAVLKKQRKYAEVEEVLQEALRIEREGGSNNQQSLEGRLYDLADHLYRHQKYAQAEPLYREMLQSLLVRHSATDDPVLGITAALARLLSDWSWAERPEKSEIQNPKSEIVQRTREAESLLRECLTIRLRGTNANQWRIADLKSRLGGALLVVAVMDPSLTAEARQSKFAEAEAFLLEGHKRLQQSKSAGFIYKRDGLERLVRLYEAWEVAAPNTGKSVQAEEWRRKLEAVRAKGENSLDSK